MSLERLRAALADRYRLERELGAGGMATVYLAEDVRHGRKVAVKVLKPELSAVIGAERFVREIHTIAALQHPHILGLIDSGEVDGTAYYVMPFVEGESLRDRLTREKQLPIADAVRIATEVAGALDYAHRHGVIHRDIKPENILLHDGSALVADFGIALAVSSAGGGTRMTETGMSLGTPQYMSPEQAMGERDLDARADVYALGCVLYELLAGEPPFTGPTAQAIVAKVVTAAPEALTTYRKTVPPAVEEAVVTALQKLPADRFASAAEFAQALAGQGGGIATAPRRTGRAPLAPGWKAIVRHPIVWGLALVALAAVAFAVRERSAGRGEVAQDVLRFRVDPPEGYRNLLWDANGIDVAISRDGSALAVPVIDPQGVQRLYFRKLSDSAGRVLPGGEGAFAPQFSDDGASLVFYATGRILRLDLTGGAPQVVAETGNINSFCLASDRILVGRSLSDPALSIVPLGGGSTRRAVPLDSAHGEVQQNYPASAGDRRHVFYASGGIGGLESFHIGLLDVTTGRARRLEIQGAFPLGVLDGRLIYVDQSGSILAVPVDLGSGKVSGQPTPVANGVMTVAQGAAVAALSASGTLLWVGKGQGSRLVLASPTQRSALPVETRSYAYPRYSPDGRRLAVTITTGASSDVWLVDLATGGLTRLTSGRSVNERPEWTPDGRRVLFRSTDADGRSGLWWQPADGSGPATPLLVDSSGSYFEGVITPDGRSLVYQEDNGQANVMIRKVDGSGSPRAIAATNAVEDQARVSPDGRWVAYVTTESGNPEVVVQALAEGGARTQVSLRGGSEPVWARDGRRIFYRNEGKFLVADVTANPTFQVTQRSEFMEDAGQVTNFPHASYDVTPDGSRLLVRQGDRLQLQVVYNWRAEVEAALRGTGRK